MPCHVQNAAVGHTHTHTSTVCASPYPESMIYKGGAGQPAQAARDSCSAHVVATKCDGHNRDGRADSLRKPEPQLSYCRVGCVASVLLEMLLLACGQLDYLCPCAGPEQHWCHPLHSLIWTQK